ncbi:hypothetical protein [Nonomuraea cypriaca]|nr:hypothetical protein [Nonomuraea cypriaca]
MEWRFEALPMLVTDVEQAEQLSFVFFNDLDGNGWILRRSPAGE